MAEWDPSCPTKPPDRPAELQPPPPSPLPPLPTRSKTRSRPPLPPPAPPPTHPAEPDRSSQTEIYIVQVPKEQIFRVPPSKNAQLAEEYRRRMHSRRRRCPSCLGCLLCLLSFLLLAVCLTAGILFLVVRPGIPSFSVESLMAKKLRSKISEEFTLKVRSHNPSSKMGYCYDAGGKVALSINGKDIAAGKTPAFCQASSSSSAFNLEIEGSPTNLSKKTGPLVLLIQFPVKLTVAGMQVLSRSLDVTCDFMLGGLGTTNNTGVVSQERCRAKMH